MFLGTIFHAEYVIIIGSHLGPCTKRCVFVVIENALIDSRPHCRFEAFSTVLTKTFENDRIARCDAS